MAHANKVVQISLLLCAPSDETQQLNIKSPLHEEKMLPCFDKVSALRLIVHAWSLYNKAYFHLTNPFQIASDILASGNDHEHISKTLIVYFRLESCLLTDKFSTNQNIVITVFLSVLFIALVYRPLVVKHIITTASTLMKVDTNNKAGYIANE